MATYLSRRSEQHAQREAMATAASVCVCVCVCVCVRAVPSQFLGLAFRLSLPWLMADPDHLP